MPLASAALGVALFLVSWGFLHERFYARDQIPDTPIYERYGESMTEGRMPYRDFRVEYPPAALPVFLLPALGEGDSRSYNRRFEGLMAGLGVACLLLVAAISSSPWAPIFVAAAPLALGSVYLSRFDLWPAALAAGALAALVAGRDRLGSGALALAAATKVYPVVLVPLAAAWIWRRHGRGEALRCGAIFAAALGACLLPFAVVAPDGLAASIGRQLSRPLQIESLGSAVLLALGVDVEMESSHGSQNVAGTPGLVVGILATLVQAAGLLWVWVAFGSGAMTRERLVRYAAAAVLAFVALGKVLSPQFLIWLVPLLPLVRGRRGLLASTLLGAALLLTQLWFPFRYWEFALGFDETISWLVLGRDLMLVAALVVLLAPEGRGAPDSLGHRGGRQRSAPQASTAAP